MDLAEQRSTLGEGHVREGRLGSSAGEVAHTGSGSPIHMPKSGSSSSNHPPGASQVTIRRSRSTLGDMCMSTARVWMRSNEPGGNVVGADVVRRTSTFEASIRLRNPICRSVATTRPVGPTVSDSQRADRPSPATDLQTPGALARPPRLPMRRFVSGSRRCSNS